MNIKSFQINELLQLVSMDLDQAMSQLQNPDAKLWIDLQGFDSDELEEWLDKFQVEDLARWLCLESQDHCGFYPFKKEICFVIPVLTDTEDDREVDYIIFLCRENLLLTLHSKSILSPEDLGAFQGSDAWLPQRSISGLVSSIVMGMSLECLQRSAKLRRSIIGLEEQIELDADSVPADQIVEIRADLLAFGAMISDQIPPIKALSRTDKPFFVLNDAKEYMNCAVSNLMSVDRALDWLDGRVETLRGNFQMNAQDKTNRRLNMLTILSTICMPVTLMTGLWGMNFESMPELSYPHSYPIALGFMVLLGSGMYFFFRKNGWFD